LDGEFRLLLLYLLTDLRGLALSRHYFSPSLG
jgi:hypothetical protein